jgi:hypothetical protein
MSGEIDLSGEQDPTERMEKQDEQLRQRVEDADDDLREAEHQGSLETDEFDLDDALEAL